jgi:hypothetical protein
LSSGYKRLTISANSVLEGENFHALAIL